MGQSGDVRTNAYCFENQNIVVLDAGERTTLLGLRPKQIDGDPERRPCMFNIYGSLQFVTQQALKFRYTLRILDQEYDSPSRCYCCFPAGPNP
jgi:hypothetical protein